MIYYFSGTGNTRFCAGELSDRLGEPLIHIAGRDAAAENFEGRHLGFMFPVYAWGVPPIMLEFIDRLPQSLIDVVKKKNIPVWMVCTCGDETGNAPAMFREALRRRGLEAAGVWSVIMPDVYVLLPGFDVDSAEEETRKLDQAPQRVASIAASISKGEWEEDVVYGSMPKTKTRIVFPLFRRWGMNTRKWRHTEECVGCGKCATVCPVGNIRLHAGRPVWGKKCVSCLACYHYCPTHAIEYGRRTLHKGQYTCPLKAPYRSAHRLEL